MLKQISTCYLGRTSFTTYGKHTLHITIITYDAGGCSVGCAGFVGGTDGGTLAYIDT